MLDALMSTSPSTHTSVIDLCDADACIHKHIIVCAYNATTCPFHNSGLARGQITVSGSPLFRSLRVSQKTTTVVEACAKTKWTAFVWRARSGKQPVPVLPYP